MGIFERGETYAHWTTIRDRNDVKVSPTTVKISIYEPCGASLISNATMTASSTGIYYYNYDTISSTATYGKYEVKVVATSGTSQVGTYISHFYVMPWKVEESVRQKMGIVDGKDIDDDALSELCWMAYKKVLRDVYIHVYNETPCGNPDTGAMFDGSNIAFQTKYYPIADINGDGVVTGNTILCNNDMEVKWISNTGHMAKGLILVTEPENGEIVIIQASGSPIPADNEGVYIDYWYEHDIYNEFLFREAVSYLASHYVNLRLTERDKVTLADISRSTPIVMLQPTRYFNEYRRLLKQVSKPKIGGV